MQHSYAMKKSIPPLLLLLGARQFSRSNKYSVTFSSPPPIRRVYWEPE